MSTSQLLPQYICTLCFCVECANLWCTFSSFHVMHDAKLLVQICNNFARWQQFDVIVTWNLCHDLFYPPRLIYNASISFMMESELASLCNHSFINLAINQSLLNSTYVVLTWSVYYRNCKVRCPIKTSRHATGTFTILLKTNVNYTPINLT